MAGMDLFISIKDIQRGFNNKMRPVTGHGLARFDAGIQLAVPAIGLGCFQINAGTAGVIGVDVTLIVDLNARGPTVMVKSLGPGIHLVDDRLHICVPVYPDSGESGLWVYQAGSGVHAGLAWWRQWSGQRIACARFPGG